MACREFQDRRLTSPLAYHYFVVGVVLCGMYAVWRIVHSPFGRVLQALRDNEQRVRCLGYDTKRIKLIAFIISATVIGLGGSLLTFLIQSVYADNLNWQHAGDPVMMTILGGIHHFLGPTWGAVIFIILSDQLSSLTEHWWLFFGAILIAFILLSPEGISGIWIRLTGSAELDIDSRRHPVTPAKDLKGLLDLDKPTIGRRRGDRAQRRRPVEEIWFAGRRRQSRSEGESTHAA